MPPAEKIFLPVTRLDFLDFQSNDRKLYWPAGDFMGLPANSKQFSSILYASCEKNALASDAIRFPGNLFPSPEIYSLPRRSKRLAGSLFACPEFQLFRPGLSGLARCRYCLARRLPRWPGTYLSRLACIRLPGISVVWPVLSKAFLVEKFVIRAMHALPGKVRRRFRIAEPQFGSLWPARRDRRAGWRCPFRRSPIAVRSWGSAVPGRCPCRRCTAGSKPASGRRNRLEAGWEAAALPAE